MQINFMHWNGSNEHEAIWNGFIALGLCSLWGWRLLIRGLRGEIFYGPGQVAAPRSWFIGTGILLQLPLIGFCLVVSQSGLLGY
jgi:hypothetical protein